MYMDGNSYETLMASLIHSAPAAADHVKAMLLAYARADDYVPYLEQIDSKLHNTIRTMVEELNAIEEPETLDREVEQLLRVIDRLVQELKEAKTLPPDEEPNAADDATKPKAKKKRSAKKRAPQTAKKKTSAKKKSGVKKTGKKAPAKKVSRKAPAKKTKRATAKTSKKPSKAKKTNKKNQKSQATAKSKPKKTSKTSRKPKSVKKQKATKSS